MADFGTRRLLSLHRSRPGICASNSHNSGTIVTHPTASVTSSVLRATLIGGAATIIAQLVGCPLDVVSKLALANGRTGLIPRLQAATALVRSNGPGALYKGLPNHLMKHAPMKTLTVALFELLQSRHPDHPTTRARHFQAAFLAASVSLFATYPLSVLYQAQRKSIPAAAIISRIHATGGGVLYAGVLPSLLAVAPSIVIDYNVYSSTRARLTRTRCASVQVADARHRTPAILPSTSTPTATPLVAIIVAAALSKMVAGAFAEPLKMVARRSAVAALRGNSHAPAVVARELLAKGPLEFWNGFRARSVRYAATAAISKTMVQRLRAMDAHMAAAAAH